MDVNFKYAVDEKVVTPLSDAVGIVSMLGFDEGGKQYYIITNDKGLSDRWWREKLLTKPESKPQV